MNKIVLFDTSCGSHNLGDYIICESVAKELSDIIGDNYLVRYATHTPIEHFYQNNHKNPAYTYCKEATYKFIAGTNILQYDMLHTWTNWNVNVFNCVPYIGSILVGAGVYPNRPTMNRYTQHLYKKMLSKQFIHATRDDRAKEALESLGMKAINTGCATTWSLTKKHCAQIPEKKSPNVIFTLTDYHKDIKADQSLIDLLVRNYEKIYFWIQGTDDFEYFKILQNTNTIQIIPPNLYQYKRHLISGNVDYIGTRLHAGIYAMQNFVRSIILIVDNRAADIQANYGLPAIDRHNVTDLEAMLNSDFTTNVHINEDNIRKWKEQFNKK